MPGTARPVTPAAEDRSRPRFRLRLGVTSDVAHWYGPGGEPLAYEPYVREMRLWGSMFSRVEVCAPRGEGPLRGTLVPYAVDGVRWTPVRYSLRYGPRGQARRALQLAGMVRAVHGLIRRSDVVLLRSPGHLSLIGRAMAGAFGVPTITKWAGPFFPYRGERIPTRLERAHVRMGPGTALVYGPATRDHLVSFFPATMSEVELATARRRGASRRWEPPWEILAVGRLHPVKGFDLVLRGLRRLHEHRPDLPWRFTLIGDGAERSRLEKLVGDGGLRARVRFTGALEFAAVQEHYARAHIVIMPGTTEGWGKPINEAWAFGAVPVVAASGIGPWILRRERSGITFEPTPDGLARALEWLLVRPDELRAVGALGTALAADISLERFAEAVEAVLVERIGLDRPGR